jgi:hypothetical protein
MGRDSVPADHRFRSKDRHAMSDDKKPANTNSSIIIQPNRMYPPRIYLPPLQPCPGCGNPGGRMCRVPGVHCGY